MQGNQQDEKLNLNRTWLHVQRLSKLVDFMFKRDALEGNNKLCKHLSYTIGQQKTNIFFYCCRI